MLRSQAILVLLLTTAAQAQRPMTPLDVVTLPSLGDTRVSPDESHTAYTVERVHWAKGKEYSDLFLAANDGSARRQLTFTETATESSPRWAADSSALAFLSDRADGKRQVFWLQLGGGEAQQLTSVKEGVRSFDITADSRWLIYLADEGAHHQLHHIDLTSPEKKSQSLGEHPTGVDRFWLNPAQSEVLFRALEADTSIEHKRKKRGFDVKINDPLEPEHNLWSVDIATKAKTRVTPADGLDLSTQLRISPDGRHLQFTARPHKRWATYADWEVYYLDRESNNLQRLTKNAQSESIEGFSPDGQFLAYRIPENGKTHAAQKVVRVEVATGKSTQLLGGWNYDGRVDIWSGDKAYFAPTVGARAPLFEMPLSGGAPEQLTSADEVLSLRERQPGQSTVLLTRSSPRSLAELYAATEATLSQPAEWIKLSNLNESLDGIALPRHEVVRWKSSDGQSVEGVLYFPNDYAEGQRYPLAVQIHGGPAGTSTVRFQNRWSTYVPVLTGRGYAVLQPNYRGSAGYGAAFRQEIAEDYFRQAFDDIMLGVDAMIDRGLADPDKLVHMGWSAGGHWSNWALTHTDRFKAIATGAGAVNWISMWAQSDVQVVREHYFGGKPYENRDHYLEVSPITYIENAKTPTLILCGAADERVPNAQSRELYTNLFKLGVPVEYIEFPNMPHGLTNPRYQFVKMHAELAWFDKWLNNKEEWLDWEALLESVPDSQD